MTRRFLAAACLLLALTAHATEDDLLQGDVLAVVDGDLLRNDDFFRFVGHELAADERAHTLLDQMIQERVVEAAARRAGLTVTDDELARRFQALEEETRAHSAGKESLQSILRRRGIARDQFLEGFRYTLLAEHLVRREFKLAAGAAVPYEKTNLWLQDHMARAVIEKDGLPPDVLARVNAEPITTLEFGRRYVADLGVEDPERENLVTEFVDAAILARAAAAHGVAVTEADLDAAVAARAAKVAADPRYRGATLEQLLEKTGRSVDWLRQSARFRNRLLLEELVEARYPGSALRAWYAERRTTFDEAFGPSVRVRALFLRAGHEGAVTQGFVPRLYEDAERELNAVKERVAAGKAELAELAEGRSEHGSRAQGGDLGFIRFSTPRMEEVARAALAEPRDHVPIGPIRTVDGVWLVEVLERAPAPGFDELEEEVRRRAAAELFQELRGAATVRRRD